MAPDDAHALSGIGRALLRVDRPKEASSIRGWQKRFVHSRPRGLSRLLRVQELTNNHRAYLPWHRARLFQKRSLAQS